jgi:sugar phosphate isomerase/epimerase
MSELAISTWIVGEPLPQVLDHVQQLGVNLIELLAGAEPEGLDLREESAVIEVWDLAEARGLEVYSVHNEFGAGWDLAAPASGARALAVANTTALIQAAGKLGAHHVVLHAGTRTVGEEVAPQLERFLGSAQRLLPVAAEAGMLLALENLPPTYLGATPAEIGWLLERLNSELVGYCCDTGHAQLAGAAPGLFVQEFGERLLGVHLQDTDGREDSHLFPGLGCVEWEGFFAALREARYELPVGLEAPPPGGLPWTEAVAIAVSAAHALQPFDLPEWLPRQCAG